MKLNAESEYNFQKRIMSRTLLQIQFEKHRHGFVFFWLTNGNLWYLGTSLQNKLLYPVMLHDIIIYTKVIFNMYR
jgi:hypothetical protein